MIVRKVQVAGIDTAVAISVLKTRNLVVREVHRTDGIFGSGVEDIGYLFQLVVRAGERFHVIVSAVISVHIFYLVNLVVVQIDLGQVDFLTESMYGTYLIACHVEHTQFHHLFQLVVFGGSCQFVVAQVQYLNLVTALTVDEVIPVVQQHIARNFLVAGHIQHLEFRQFC